MMVKLATMNKRRLKSQQRAMRVSIAWEPMTDGSFRPFNHIFIDGRWKRHSIKGRSTVRIPAKSHGSQSRALENILGGD